MMIMIYWYDNDNDNNNNSGTNNNINNNNINPLVPKVQKIKIQNLTLNRLLIIEFVKKMVYLDAHNSEH